MLAWVALLSDQEWLETEYGSLFNVRNRVYAYLADPSLRADFWFRVAAGCGLVGAIR
jgi:hypothetical protein